MGTLGKLLDIEGKVVLFTGGYGYLGSSTVEYLASIGAKVYVLARDENKFKATFDSKENIFFEFCDISNELYIEKSINNIFNIEGKINGIINNAIYLKGQSPEKMIASDFTYGLEGVLTSVYLCIKHIIPIFKNQGFGKIINVSSMYGVVAPDFDVYDRTPEFLNPPHYGAAKAGVIQLTKYYASLLGKYNIQVNSLTPGPFPSKAVQEESKYFIDKLKEKTLLNRIGKPEDLIGAYILLLSSGSDYITGQNIVVDGGWTSK